MMSHAVLAAALEREPAFAGTSAAWTSGEPIVRRARELVAAGRWAQAEQLVGASRVPSAVEMGEIISRLRWEYGLDEAGLLEKVRKGIADVTAGDLRRWREDGGLQWRMIDGRIGYFRREPGNLYRFCAEARRRRKEDAKTEKGFLTEKHLAEVIAAAESSAKSDVLPIRHRVRYSVTVPGDHAAMKVGAVVRCWLPFSQEHARQRDVRLVRSYPEKCVAAKAGMGHRSVYLEQRVEEVGKPMLFKVEFEYTSAAYYPVLRDGEAKALSGSYDGGYLSERPPHIAFSAELKETVAKVVGGQTNPLVKARRIFEFVHSEIAYCAEEEYCLIPSFSEKALRTRRGDCGIQSMLFITMCRAAGIPSRWQSGWETRPGLVNMHDWAEFYVEPWGWLPADPSYGLRESGDPKVRYFYFGHQDSYRMIVNLDYGAPLVPAKRALRSEPADFQRGEVEIDGRNLYFNEWQWEMDVEYGAK